MLVLSATAVNAQTCRMSWYKMGHTTANGEHYNPNGLSAASKTLPFNTKVKVSYNNRSVIVRVNDRGPFVKSRCMDLSKGSMEALHAISHGIILANLEIVR